MLMLGCSMEAQQDGMWTGHQEAHPMRMADGRVRTMPDGTPIQLAGGTFTLELAADGRIAVDRKLDDGRAFSYVGQCTQSEAGWACQAEDGVGVPLVFDLVFAADGRTAEYRSRGYDPAFGLTPVSAAP
jgi:hypothetical protein